MSPLGAHTVIGHENIGVVREAALFNDAAVWVFSRQLKIDQGPYPQPAGTGARLAAGLTSGQHG